MRDKTPSQHAVGFPCNSTPPPPCYPGAKGASQVLRRLSSCMPRPEDSGGPAPPRHYGGARVAFGSVKALGVRNKPCRSCTSTSGCAVTPAAYRMLCLRFVHLVRRVVDHDSAMDARLDTGGWLTLTRQGLAPCKRRQAFLARQRWRSPAAGSGRDAGADAVSSQVQCMVRRECAHGGRICLQLRSGSYMTHGLHSHSHGETTPSVVTSLPHGTVWSKRNFFVPSWHDTLHRCLYRFDPPLYTGP